MIDRDRVRARRVFEIADERLLHAVHGAQHDHTGTIGRHANLRDVRLSVVHGCRRLGGEDKPRRGTAEQTLLHVLAALVS